MLRRYFYFAPHLFNTAVTNGSPKKSSTMHTTPKQNKNTVITEIAMFVGNPKVPTKIAIETHVNPIRPIPFIFSDSHWRGCSLFFLLWVWIITLCRPHTYYHTFSLHFLPLWGIYHQTWYLWLWATPPPLILLMDRTKERNSVSAKIEHQFVRNWQLFPMLSMYKTCF